MNPVKGPITRTWASAGVYQRVVGYRQKRPYTLTLPVSRELAFATPSQEQRWLAFAISSDPDGRAYAKAYARVVDGLGDPAGMGLNLAQWKQADSMISKRASQLTGFTKAVLRRSPAGIASSLGLSLRDVRRITGTRYGVAKSLSDLWLEFWFGWKPMISDIYTACDVLNRDIPWGQLKGSGSVAVAYLQKAPPPERPDWDGFEGIEFSGKSRCKIGINVRIKNPNVHLLNQLGLLNPALIAYDAIPWSFLLGWVSNVDQYLSAFTDFAGLETGEGYVTTSKEVSGKTWWTGGYPHVVGPGYGLVVSRASVSSLPRPRFAFKELKFPVTRGATAISLLVQQLSKVTADTSWHSPR